MFSFVLRTSALGVLLGLFSSTGWSCPADDKDEKSVELNVGDKAPAFATASDTARTWVSAEHYGKKWVVIYFYPGDFTPGCTAQARAFRDAMHKLTEKGVEVVGVSGDSVETHEFFKKDQMLNFTLLSDEDGSVARLFGVPVKPGAKVKAKSADGKITEIMREKTLARWTFIIDKDGKIAYKNMKVNPADDAKKITEFIDKAEAKP